MRYWKGCFPEDFTTVLAAGRRSGARPHAVTIARVTRTTRPAVERRLARLLRHSPDEPWAVPQSNYVGFASPLWPSRARPSGFTAFTIQPEHDPRSGRLAYVGFHGDLLWVTPDARGAGIGSVLAGAMVEWLHACRVTPPRSRRAGVLLSYVVDQYSDGGTTLSTRIRAAFHELAERRDRGRPWAIEEFSDESDDYDAHRTGEYRARPRSR